MKLLKKITTQIRKINHRRIDFLRSLRYRFFLLFLNQKNSLVKNVKYLSSEKKILILRLDGKLGDTITITGFLQELYENGYHIDIVTRNQQSFVYEFIQTPIKVFKIRNFFSVFKVYFQIFRNQYTAIFCTTHLLDPASLFLARFLTSPHKIVFLNKELQFFNHHIVENFNHMHVTDRYQEALKLIGIENSSLVHQYRLNFTKEATIRFLEQRAQVGFKDHPYIVLNSFAGSNDRNLSFEFTKKLIEELIAKFPKHHIVSIGSLQDISILNTWSQKMSYERWHFFKSGDFAFNAAVIQHSDIVISPDTAIIHLASCLNCKIVGIFRVAGDVAEYPYVWAPLVAKDSFEIIYAYNAQINRVPTSVVVAAVQKLIVN